jgi:hypothetical protein
MKIIDFKDAIKTSPPSRGFVFLPESDADKYMLVEMSDLQIARRAPTVALQQAGRTGRVVMQSLQQNVAQHQLSPEYVTELLAQCERETGVPAEQFAKFAFYIRFFEW